VDINNPQRKLKEFLTTSKITLSSSENKLLANLETYLFIDPKERNESMMNREIYQLVGIY